MIYKAPENRYSQMVYRRCGKSGLMLPAISLGLWHNFGHVDCAENFTQTIFTAFDNGITHFDLANNYGPPPGSAEENFGRILRTHLKAYRDELIITSKAGHDMWEGPYGEHASRKHLMASLDQSLKRMGLEYVDIFYSHCPDPETPIEETAETLSDMVRQGKALYVGISKYSVEQTRKIMAILRSNHTPCIVHQDRYSMFIRDVENGLLDTIEAEGMGMVAFSPLAQGLLTNRYLNGIPADSRAARNSGFLKLEEVTDEKIARARKLADLAAQRGQSLPEMALAWLLRDSRVASVIVGASSAKQLMDNLKAIDHLTFSSDELQQIDAILK